MLREHVRSPLRGRTWTLDEMEGKYGDRWNFGEVATVTVRKQGGLSDGQHRLTVRRPAWIFQGKMRITFDQKAAAPNNKGLLLEA